MPKKRKTATPYKFEAGFKSINHKSVIDDIVDSQTYVENREAAASLVTLTIRKMKEHLAEPPDRYQREHEQIDQMEETQTFYGGWNRKRKHGGRE